MNNTIGQYVGLTTKVLLQKQDAHNYSVQVITGNYDETEYFSITKDERENIHWMEWKKGYENLVFEVQEAVEKRAEKYYNEQVEKVEEADELTRKIERAKYLGLPTPQ